MITYADREVFERKTRLDIENTITEVLRKHCGEECKLLSVDLELYEEVEAREDLGFESLDNTADSIDYKVSRANISVQVNNTVTDNNKQRLSRLISLRFQKYGLSTDINWESVELPSINRKVTSAKDLEILLSQRLRENISSVFDTYCPDSCLIEKISIDAESISLNNIDRSRTSQIFYNRAKNRALYVKNIVADITMDEKVDRRTRQQIEKILIAKTRFIEPVQFNINLTMFPESFYEKEKRLKLEKDPYGLEKLRQMLIIFRDLAGTKEIISTSRSLESTTTNNESTASSSEVNSQVSSTTNEKQDSSNLESSSTDDALISEGLLPYIAGAGALFLVLLFLAMRYTKAKNDAKELMMVTPQNTLNDPKNEKKTNSELNSHTSSLGLNEEASEDFKIQLEIENLKTELMNVFVKNPKVAKETFGRFLKEDGVFETSKFVHIFGHVIIFELLSEPKFRRELDDLSEYYHRSNLQFTDKETHELLLKLKTRVTASEIKVLSRKSSEEFEFLSKLAANKIYQLIRDEKIQVQGIVMTQLDKKTRSDVFDLYPNELRASLLTALSFADAVPKEYLFNIAKTLQKKVQASSEFDTENLSSNDILLDLLEKSPINDQKMMMSSLRKKSPDVARVIKSRLITMDTLPYLKDGHLLEVVIGLERDILLDFLSSTRQEVRDLVLNKAPVELVESWIEEIQMRGLVAEEKNRAAHIMVIERIRSLASNGIINILEINEIIFKDLDDREDEQITEMSNQANSQLAA